MAKGEKHFSPSAGSLAVLVVQVYLLLVGRRSDRDRGAGDAQSLRCFQWEESRDISSMRPRMGIGCGIGNGGFAGRRAGWVGTF